MRKARAILLAGLGAVSLTGAAAAPGQKTHTMSVPLPDGSIAKIEYVGDVAPKVTIDPAPVPRFFGGFGAFDRTMTDMRRQMDAMIRRMRQMQSRPVTRARGMNIASYGDMPEGSTSVSVVSTTNGGKTCTRTTEVTSQGAGKPPKVVERVSGDCAPVQPPAAAIPTA
jgi:hypothetical protein